jgi:hypothetical protein
VKRPAGVTVITAVNICAAVLLLLSILASAGRSKDASLALFIVIVVVLVDIGFSVALFKLVKWARSVTVLSYGFSLFRALFGTTRAIVAGISPLLLFG